MKIKNGLVVYSMFFFCSSLIFGMQPQKQIFCPIVNLENGKMKWNQAAGCVRQSKLKQFQQGVISENDTVHEVNITKVKRRDVNEYHLAVPNKSVDYAVNLSEQDINTIRNLFQQDKPIFFEIYDPVLPDFVKAKVKITPADLETVLNAEPITIEQKYQVLPHDPVQIQQQPKPQKAVLPQPIQHPIKAPQSINDTLWNTTFVAPHKSILRFDQTTSPDDKNGLNYIAQLSDKELEDTYLSLKNTSKQASSFLAEEHIKKQLPQKFIDLQIKKEADAFFESHKAENQNAQSKYYSALADVLEKRILSLKIDPKCIQKDDVKINSVALEIIQHYMHHVECNDDLGRPTFEEYANALQVVMRKKDHKNSAERDSGGPLFKTFAEINKASGLVIKKHQDLLEDLAKQKEQWTKDIQKEKDEIDQEIFDHKKSALFVPLVQTAFSLASQEVGHMVASALLSLIPHPELEKELADLKEEIANQEKKLKENILENSAKKHTNVLFEQSQDRKKLLDGYNDQRKKPTQMELLQSLKDRHAKKYK